MSNKTAAIIIIGNEILSGRTQDLNIQFIASELNQLGIKLIEVAIIPDIMQTIINTVQKFSNNFDYVFTTGGIGPTHDDITTEAIAKATDRKLELNEYAKDVLIKRAQELGYEFNEANLKMAYIPVSARLINNPISGAPGFNIDNIYVLAGVPKIMQAMFKETIPYLECGQPIQSRSLEVHAGEGKIAKIFEDLQHKYPEIDMGSYPFEINNRFATTLVLRSSNTTLLNQAFNELKSLMDSLTFHSFVV